MYPPPCCLRSTLINSFQMCFYVLSLQLFTKSPHVLGLFHITTLPKKKGIFVYELQNSKALQSCIDRNLAVVDKMANALLEKKRVVCLLLF